MGQHAKLELQRSVTKPTVKRIQIRCQATEEYEEVKALLLELRGKTLHVLHEGQRMTLLVLQHWRNSPDGFEVRFTPGVLEALGSKLEPLELLRRAVANAH